MRKLFISFLAAALSTCPLSAAVTDFSKQTELPQKIEGDLTCKAICTYTPKPGEVYYVKIGSTYHIAPLVGENISVQIPIRKTRAFVLYIKSKNEEGEDIYTPALTETLPGSGTEYLVILSKKKDSPITSKVYSLGTNKLPANHIHLFNYSPVPLGIQVEETKYLAQRNQHLAHRFKAAGRSSYTSANIVMRYQGENKVMASRRIRLVPGRRILLVCFASAERAKKGATPLRMLTIQDMP